jgi:pSer/pThr/pTyr-binding forkhead associated (FHA) protein
MAKLVVRLGDKTKQVVNLDLPTVTLGRGSAAQIVIDDPLVSREHCRVRLMGDGHVVIDLQSRTGTYVNGSKIEGSQILEPGDELGLGKHTIVYEYGEVKVTQTKTQDTGEFWLSSVAETSPMADVDPKGKDRATRKKAAETPTRAASDLTGGSKKTVMEDYQGTMLASAGELQRARQLAMVMQKPHVKYRQGKTAHTVSIGTGWEVGFTADADLRLQGSRLLGKRQFRLEPGDDGTDIEVLSFWARVEVSGKRIRGRQALANGARIKAAGKTFQYGAGDDS